MSVLVIEMFMMFFENVTMWNLKLFLKIVSGKDDGTRSHNYLHVIMEH
jgi:hypothetical protein